MRSPYGALKQYLCFIFIVFMVVSGEALGSVVDEIKTKERRSMTGMPKNDVTHISKGRTLCQLDNVTSLPKKLIQDSGPRSLGAFYGFLHGFVASVSVIIVSELGDKTFFIAAIMAMRHPRTTVFAGALGALGLMTVLSSALGFATTIIPRKYTFYISTALFVYFGLRMLYEGYKMDPNEGQEEYEEVQAELKKKEEELEESSRTSVVEDPESGVIRVKKSATHCFGLVSPILLQSFTLTFLAEWGDRSQLTTIILATREDVIGVTLGGTLGHAICTGLAVIGGRLIAQKISVKTVTIIGGIVFLLFALSALIMGP